MFHFQGAENGNCILGLCKHGAIPMLLKFNAKKAGHWAKSFEIEMGCERGDKVMYFGREMGQ